MKRFLRAALANPKPGDSAGGVVYVCPAVPYNTVARVRYWRTYYALKERDLIEYTARLRVKSELTGEESRCMASVLTDRGIEAARVVKLVDTPDRESGAP